MLAWTSSAPGIYLKRWNGASWEELGGSATGSGLDGAGFAVFTPSLALDGSGNPIVAWTHGTASAYAIYLKRWNGTAWEEIGGSASGFGISAPSTTAAEPSLVLDSSGRPVIAWSDSSSGNAEIYLKRWNGSSWEDLGGSASGGGISATPTPSREPSLRLDSADRPAVAWTEQLPSGSRIYFKRWNGTSWEDLGGSASGFGISP
ncbi:MAG: hypothetical protein ACK44W_04460 [Planctomycetota bacterium]